MTLRCAGHDRRDASYLKLGVYLGAAAALAFSLLLTPSAAEAAAGDLDHSFGTRGVVRTDFGRRTPAVRAVAIDSQGRLVAAGETALARYMPDGSLDRSFSDDGKRRIGLQAYSMVIDSRDRIVVAGIRNPTRDDPDIALARYTPDGSLDPSFGENGKVTTNFGADNADYAESIAIDDRGRLVVGGATGAPNCNPHQCTNDYDLALLRFRPNGTPDDSFGGDGRVSSDFGSIDEFAYGIAIDRRGRIVAAGVGSATGRFLVARYQPTGSLDPSFSGDGFTTTGFPGAGESGGARATPIRFSLAFGVTIDRRGRIVAAGEAGSAKCGSCSAHTDFALARYDADGSLDSSFGRGGRKTTDFRARDNASAVEVDSRGRIVAAGPGFDASIRHPTFELARYTRHGKLDPAFSGNGKTRRPHGRAYGMTIDRRDRIVAGGKSAGELTLARYLGAPNRR
jgi:uncharacterized delta-60 repeat protein